MKKIATLLTSLLLVTAIIFPNQSSAQSCPWAKKAGGTNEDQGTAVATDASGNVYYLGNFYSHSIVIGTTTLQNQPYQAFNYGSEMFLAKYDSCGTFKWAKQAGGKSDVYGADLAVDAAGNIYVTGYFQTDTAFFGSTYLLQSSYQDAFLVKYRPNGTMIWAKSASGNDQDQGRAITVDALGDVYITGTFASTSITFGSSSIINGTNDGYTTDGFIAKFDTSGANIWVRGNTSNSATSGHVTPFAVGSDATGNVYVGGRFYSSEIRFGIDSLPNTNTSYSDIFVTKYDGGGNFKWLRSAGASGDDGIYGMASDATGNSYVTGYVGGGTTTFGTGVSVSSSQMNRALFIAKYDNAGTALWAKTAIGDYWSDDFATAISLDANSNAFITGTYSSDTLYLGPVKLANMSSGGANPDYFYDIFVAKYKPNGILSWARSAGGDSTDIGDGITTGPHGALYITGTFNSPTLSFAGAPTLSLTAGSLVGSYNPGMTSNDAFISNNIATLPASFTPNICLASADTMWSGNQYNIVYWDKTPYTTVSNFIIYREVTSGVYKKIGSQPYSALSRFVDTLRSVGPANGDPNLSTYRYKLQVMDTSGTYSFMSPYHNSVYFQNNSGTFNWNLYAVESMTITPVSQYDLMRDDNHTGAWHSIGTTAGTQTTLNDPQYSTFQATADWRVDAQGFNCTPTMRLGNNANQSAIVKSKSNISNNRGIGVNQITSASVLNIYPNPAKGLFVIETNLTEKQHIQVIDVNGKIILSTTITGTTSIDASNLSEGVYTINIVNNSKVENKRLVIVK